MEKKKNTNKQKDPTRTRRCVTIKARYRRRKRATRYSNRAVHTPPRPSYRSFMNARDVDTRLRVDVRTHTRPSLLILSAPTPFRAFIYVPRVGRNEPRRRERILTTSATRCP
jgi:hypothetical protein